MPNVFWGERELIVSWLVLIVEYELILQVLYSIIPEFRTGIMMILFLIFDDSVPWLHVFVGITLSLS